MRSARIELILDTLRAIRGAKDLSKATDDLAGNLDDTARAGDKAGKAVDQAGDDMSQAARAAGKLDREIEQLTGSLREMAIAQALTGENFSKQIREQETQVRRLTRNRKLFGDFGEDAGAEAAAGFAGRFSARLGPLITSGPGLAIAATGIGLALAPTVAAAVSGAVIGGAGFGGVVGGLILASKDTRVQAAGQDLAATVLADLEQRAGQFVAPMLGGVGKVRAGWSALGGDLDRVFASSRFVDPLVDGGIAGAQRIVTGIADMISKADPVMAQLGDSVARIGATIGSTFTLLSGDAKQGASALDDLTMAVQNFITVTGDIIHAGAAVKGYLDRVDQVIDKGRIWVEDNSAIARTLSDVGISLDLTADGFKKGSVEADAYRRVTTGTGEAVDEARLKAYALAKAQGLSAEAASAAGQAAAMEALAHTTTADAMQIEKEKSEDLTKQQALLKAGQDSVTAAQGLLKFSLDSLGGATSLQGQRATALKTAMDNLYGATIRNTDANETYQASWDALSGSVKTNGHTLNVNTAAGRANRDTLEALLTSNGELYTANIAAGMSVAQATKKHEARTAAVKEEARRLGLNRGETNKLIAAYGHIPPKKTTDLVLRSVDRVADALLDLAAIQLHLAKGTALPGDLSRRLARAQYGMPDTKRAYGGPLPGHAPHDRADNMVYAGTPGEWVIQKPTVRRVERERGPGAMAYFNRYGELPAPGYADGGLLKASRTQWPPNMTYRVTADMTKVPTVQWAMSKVPFMMGGDWPSSPGAQRGDSGVWRKIVALIRSTGPMSGSFGNAYRPGDPKWHGSGRAVDWMGFNQDRLASFLAARRPLELIHRTRNRDYAYTRGVNKGSFNNSLMEAHRNHVHIAMANGGILREPVFGYGTRTGATYSLAERGPERVSPLGAAGGVTVVVQVANHGVLGDERTLRRWMQRGVQDGLDKAGRQADVYSRTG